MLNSSNNKNSQEAKKCSLLTDLKTYIPYVNDDTCQNLFQNIPSIKTWMRLLVKIGLKNGQICKLALPNE